MAASVAPWTRPPSVSLSPTRPTWARSVSVERARALAMALMTRMDGSWRPRSSWLRKGVETVASSASSRSESLASCRWVRTKLPNASSWVLQGSAGSAMPHFYPFSARVVVEAAADLAAQQPGLDHAGQQRGRSVERLLELLVERLRHGDGGVEPDEVGQGQRPHGVAEALDHA